MSPRGTTLVLAAAVYVVALAAEQPARISDNEARTSGREWHVSPNGTATGGGSAAAPWDLATALNGPAAVRPGDTIWLHGGMYGNGSTLFNSRLKGTAASPVVVRQYPGERATINGGIATYSPYTWYWGFEITNTNPDRTDTRQAPQCIDTYTGSAGVKLINLVLHDCAQGIGFWVDAVDAEAYGNLIYYNGWQGPSPDRGHGHGIYVQNRAGVKQLSDNIIFDQFGAGIHAYGSSNAFLENLYVDANVIFNNGSLAAGISKVDNLLVAAGSTPRNIRVTNNYLYDTPEDNDGYSRIGWQWSGTNDDVVVTGNYFIGGESALEMWNWNSATLTGNTVYGRDALTVILSLLAGQTTAAYSWDGNRYFGAGIFRLGDRNQSWSAWQALTGLDAHSTYTPGPPTGVWTFLRPNRYEPGRATVTVYNWDLRPNVTVYASSLLKRGARYEVRDAQNFFGPPVATGVYKGGAIAIPTTSTVKAAAVGNVPSPPRHTGPAFGVFVILPQ